MQSEQSSELQEEFAKEFISQLRELRNKSKISAREMSLSLGQNVNYINLIENGKRMPSMQGFFSICEYLNTTPSAFFAKNSAPPASTDKVWDVLSSLTYRQAQCLASMIQEFRNE